MTPVIVTAVDFRSCICCF